MRVALVYPRFRYPSGDPPLGLAYIAGYLRRCTKAEVWILDSTWHKKGWIEEQLQILRPDIVGVYTNTLGIGEANAISKWAMQEKMWVVAGGPHATVRPGDVVANRVIRGEGECAVAQLVDDHERKVGHLDELGHPAHNLLDMKPYLDAWHYLDHISPRLKGANIVASRGCLWNCTYCQPTLRQMFGKEVRYHSPGWVSTEVNWLQDRYKVDGVFFHDDTFTAKHEWVQEVCERLTLLNIMWGCNARADTLTEGLLRDMYQAGCRNIHLGIECASDRVRNEVYQKHISTEAIWAACEAAKAAGVAVMGFFMLGAPTETKEEMDDTIQLACRLPLTEATFSVTSCLPGTSLASYAARDTKDYYGSDAPGELRRLQRQALIRFYAQHWPYVARHLLSIGGIQRLLRKVGRFR